MKVRFEEVWQLNSDASPLPFQFETKALHRIPDWGGGVLNDHLIFYLGPGLNDSPALNVSEYVHLLPAEAQSVDKELPD